MGVGGVEDLSSRVIMGRARDVSEGREGRSGPRVGSVEQIKYEAPVPASTSCLFLTEEKVILKCLPQGHVEERKATKIGENRIKPGMFTKQCPGLAPEERYRPSGAPKRVRATARTPPADGLQGS